MNKNLNLRRTALAIITGIVLVLSIGLVACGGSPTSSSNGTAQTEQSAQTTIYTEESLANMYVVKIDTQNDGGQGKGQVAYTQEGAEDLEYGDSAFTHVNKGETITLKAKGIDGSKFVKWTKDGKDFSTEAEVSATIDGDTSFVAVFN